MKISFLFLSLLLTSSCGSPNKEFYACSFGQILDNNSIKIVESLDSTSYSNIVENIVKSTFRNIYYNYFGLDTAKVFVENSTECRFAAADIDLRNGRFKKKLLYNSITLEEIYSRYGNTWAIRAIIAHEVSHIVNVDKLYRDKAIHNEIWADYFAGLHMRRMGASEDEAVQPFQFLDYSISSGYPTKEERVQLVKLGWKNGKLNSDCNQSILGSIYKSEVEGIKLNDSVEINAAIDSARQRKRWTKVEVYSSGLNLYITPEKQFVKIDSAGVQNLGTLKISKIKAFSHQIEEKNGSSVWFIDLKGKIYQLSENGILVIGEI